MDGCVIAYMISGGNIVKNMRGISNGSICRP